MPVTGDHTPEDLVLARRQRGQAHLEYRIVLGIHAAVSLVDPPVVTIFHADRAKHRLDLAIKPDADYWRRHLYGMADPRLGVVGKGVRPRRTGHQEKCRRQTPPHYLGCVGPSTPLKGVQVKIWGAMSSR
jgi:hypothetical protein